MAALRCAIFVAMFTSALRLNRKFINVGPGTETLKKMSLPRTQTFSLASLANKAHTIAEDMGQVPYSQSIRLKCSTRSRRHSLNLTMYTRPLRTTNKSNLGRASSRARKRRIKRRRRRRKRRRRGSGGRGRRRRSRTDRVVVEAGSQAVWHRGGSKCAEEALNLGPEPLLQPAEVDHARTNADALAMELLGAEIIGLVAKKAGQDGAVGAIRKNPRYFDTL